MIESMPEPTLEERLVASVFSRAMASAGRALGEMTGQSVEITTPLVRRFSTDEVVELVGGPGTPVVAVYLGMVGGISGHCLVLLAPEGAHRLAQILLEGEVGDVPENVYEFDEMQTSALQELGNVTIGAFMNEIGMHLHEAVHPTVPQAVVEMCGAVLDGLLMDLAVTGERILAARTVFTENGQSIHGTFLVLPRESSLHGLLESLGVAA